MPEYSGHPREGAAGETDHRAGARPARQTDRGSGLGFTARVIQHETDHLDGILFFDRMKSFGTLTYWTSSSATGANAGPRRSRRNSPVMPIATGPEPFTSEERARLARLQRSRRSCLRADESPETVEALFARHSRSAKSTYGGCSSTSSGTGRPPRRGGPGRKLEQPHRHRAGRAALRTGLQRVRRRLGGAAGAISRASRVERVDEGARMGPVDVLSRAIDPVCSLHR